MVGFSINFGGERFRAADGFHIGQGCVKVEISEAKSIRIKLGHKSYLTPEEEFLYIEVMRYLIYAEQKVADMMCLGEFYYARKCFELALKYYEMAAAGDCADANMWLGCIWYFGRTGVIDYASAYQYFSKATEQGDATAAYLLADMYRHGHYVEADYNTYKTMIESLEMKAIVARYTDDPVPEIYVRIGGIRKREGLLDIATEYYTEAKEFLAQRIVYDPYFANLNLMRDLIREYYSVVRFDAKNAGLYDLYYCLQKPCQVTFVYSGKAYEIQAVEEDGECVIRFGKGWFRTIDHFFAAAMIDGELLTSIYDELELFEVKAWK